MSGLVFLGFFLSSFGFFADVVAFLFFFSFSFFREIDQVVTGHTPTRTLCFFVLFFLCPRRDRVYLPFWPCVLSFWRFVGVPFWAPGVFFLDSLGTWGGSEAFSRTRGGKGASLLLVPCFVFPLFVLFCGFTPFLEARVGFRAEVGSPSRLFRAEVPITGSPSPPLGRVIPRGALLARRVGPLHFRDFDGLI